MPEVLWYYAKNDQQLGPVSPTELKKLAESRALSSDDLIWREGMESWVPAARVKGLFPHSEPREAVFASPIVSNGPTETMPPTEVAAILAADPSTPLPSMPASSAVPAEVFFTPSPTNAVAEPQAIPATSETTASEPSKSYGTLDLLWLAQALLWGICIATVFLGGILLTVELVAAENAAEEAAAAVTFGTFFVAAYIIARAGERVAYLVQVYFERRRR
jgi:hypothetical protein